MGFSNCRFSNGLKSDVVDSLTQLFFSKDSLILLLEIFGSGDSLEDGERKLFLEYY